MKMKIKIYDNAGNELFDIRVKDNVYLNQMANEIIEFLREKDYLNLTQED